MITLGADMDVAGVLVYHTYDVAQCHRASTEWVNERMHGHVRTP